MTLLRAFRPLTTCALVIAGLMIGGCGPPMVVVPSVSGMSQEAAEAALTAVGLTVGTVTGGGASAKVMSQDPAAETEIAEGSPVNLVLKVSGPSAEEIAKEIRQGLAPLYELLKSRSDGRGWGSGGTGAAGMLTMPVENQVVTALRASRQKHQSSENGREAIKMATHDIEDIIRQARDQERWRLLMGCIAAFEAISPGSTKMEHLKERAKLHRVCPIVRVKGFFDDEEMNETYAFLEVIKRFFTKDGRLRDAPAETVRARPGDEFHGVKLLGFVGDRRGVRLEYLAIPGNTWEVLKP